jgi:hypothetical protein
MIFPRFNGQQNLTKDEVLYAQVQQSKTNLGLSKIEGIVYDLTIIDHFLSL